MSKKNSGLFSGTKGSYPKTTEIAGVGNYNSAGSKDVKIVNRISAIEDDYHTNVPIKDEPNSVTKILHKGKLIRERYYNQNGDVYLDIDYTNRGNAKTHPVVPHQHKWTKEKTNKISRNEWEKINNE